MVPIADLEPYPGNARHGDRDVLVESLEANGQYRSLVVRRTDDDRLVVLCGNNTLAALEHRGDEEARCEIVVCDDATALRVNLVDNASNDKATYDDEARARLVALLDGEITGTGYTEDEVDDLIARYEEPEVTAYREPEVTYNDDEEERAQRVASRGGEDSSPMVSRGIRDILVVLPNADADELGRIILRLRKEFGSLPQGEIILKGMRIAAQAVQTAGASWIYDDDEVYTGEEAADEHGAEHQA
jgi:hypothetical protein